MIGTRCQVRTCLHLAADGIGRNATNLQSRNAFSADPWRKTKAGATKER
jgi:hypothetical protein